MVFAVSGLSPVTITVRRPMRRSRSKRSRDAGLEDVFQHHQAGDAIALADQQRRRALSGDRVHLLARAGRQRAAALLDVADDGVGGALADDPAVGQIDAAHARLGRELDEPTALLHRRRGGCAFDSVAVEIDDALALRRLVGDGRQGGQLRRPRRPRSRPAAGTASPGGCPS